MAESSRARRPLWAAILLSRFVENALPRENENTVARGKVFELLLRRTFMKSAAPRETLCCFTSAVMKF